MKAHVCVSELWQNVEMSEYDHLIDEFLDGLFLQVELTNIQKKYYRAILEKNFSFLSKGANQHNMPNLINTMMELRKCCNHPYLITGKPV